MNKKLEIKQILLNKEKLDPIDILGTYTANINKEIIIKNFSNQNYGKKS